MGSFVRFVCLAIMISSAAAAEPVTFGMSRADGTVSESLLQHVQRMRSGPQVLLAACCKTCRKGKPCGDSCIAVSKSCRKGPGCAC